MTLSVIQTDTGRTIGEFTLVRGATPRLRNVCQPRPARGERVGTDDEDVRLRTRAGAGESRPG